MAMSGCLRPSAPIRKRTRSIVRSQNGLQPRVLFGRKKENDQMDQPLDQVFPDLVITGPIDFPPARKLLLLSLADKNA